MNLHRLDLVSLSLVTFVARTGSVGNGVDLTHLAERELRIGAGDLGALPQPVRLLVDHLFAAR